MDDVLAVHVCHSLAKLLEDRLGAPLGHSAALLLLCFLDHVVEALAFAKLHHQVDMSSRVNHLMQADNVRMLNHGKYENFAMKCLGGVFIFEVLLLINFQG